jgi:AraC-like DNA-binding protein
VRFDHPAARHLVSLLPGLINVDNWSLSELEWMHGTLRSMAGEARELRAGGETIITRLADILVIQAIRTWIAQDPAARTGWLGALRDQRVGRALALIHGEPERGWTVASLAEEAAMSRSAFAARFTALVGEPPMHYLTRWRMQVAVTRLSEDDTPLAVLANDLGYQSEAAFNRAFKRFAGMTPGAARRRA